jgi:hypothetical protein
MTADFPRFLNLPTNSDPFALLGLTPAQCTPANIDEALRRRIGQVYRHPDGKSEAADEVRSALREAAAALRDSFRRERLAQSYRMPHIRPALTPFDRDVLAILVGSGGWNALSRSRLITLAQSHGVAPQGLMKVITGLSQYARQGGGRIQTADIAAGGQRFRATPVPGTLDRIGEISDAIIARYAPELVDKDPHSTLKLSALFSLLVLLSAIIFVRLLLPGSTAPQTQKVPMIAPPPVVIEREDDRRIDSSQRDQGRVVTLREYPTFRIDVASILRDRAEASAQVVEELDGIARRLSITDSPSEAVFHSWNQAMRDVSLGWPMLDELDRLARMRGTRSGGELPLRQQIDRAMADVFRLTGDSLSIGSRLIEPLRPHDIHATVSTAYDPLELIRGPWQIAQLVKVSQHTALPPTIGDKARTAFALSSGVPPEASIDRLPPEQAAAIWLDAALPGLIDRLSYDDDALVRWEMWLLAHRSIAALGHQSQRAAPIDAQFDRSILNAIEQLMHSRVQLDETEPGGRLLGRLLREVDPTRSMIARERVLNLFDEERVTTERLATLTAVMRPHPDMRWMDESCLLPTRAADDVRSRVRGNIAGRWPQISPSDLALRDRSPRIDEVSGGLWLNIHDQLQRTPPPQSDDAANMRHVLSLTQLNLAAALLSSGDAELIRQGGRLLDQLEESVLKSESDDRSPRRPPTNINPRGRGPVPDSGSAPSGAGGPNRGILGSESGDGIWSASYNDARRNPNERLEQLRSLRRLQGDLGPRDAETFVREVYRATPLELREEAQVILLAHFPRGINVAMQMLDLLHEAPRTAETNDLVARYTSRSLPAARSEAWRREARRALIEHSLELRATGLPAHARTALSERIEIDRLAEQLTETAMQMSRIIDPARRGAVGVAAARTPTEAIVARHEAWRRVVGSQLPVAPTVPGDLATIERRHLHRLPFAQSPVQAYVAMQISTLELISFVTSSERPASRESLHELLETASRERLTADRLVRQSYLAERAIADVWRLRLGLANRAVMGEEARRHAGPTARSDQAIQNAQPRTQDVLGSGYSALGVSRAASERWRERLEALAPSEPMQYFELAEDIADAAADDRERDLARHLFALSGVIAPQMLGRSACLALAEMETDQVRRKRLRAMATMFDPHSPVNAAAADPSTIGNETRDWPAVLDLGEAFSALRLGRGSRAATIIRRHTVTELLDVLDRTAGIDRARLEEEARATRRPSSLISPRVDEEMLLELALLAGAERSWSADLVLHGDQPFIEADPNLLVRMLGDNAARPYYRHGHWVASANE